MAYEVDCSGVFRGLAQCMPDIIVFVTFVLSVVVFELCLDLHSPRTRPCAL